MNIIARSGAAIAVAAVAGTTIVTTPVDSPATFTEAAENAALVNLTAASSPLAQPTLAPDEIDDSFLQFRTGVRADFNAFANRLGYLGKQMYIGFNFGETVLASAVFNGTDILRGEGLFENLSDFTVDVALAAAWIVADELYLHIEDLPPIEILLNRPPKDAPVGWTRPQPPDPIRPLVPEPSEDIAAAAVEEPSASADEIDQSFIEARQEFRTAFTPVANELGYLGKQLYVAVNFVESLVASVVFNGADMLRGEGFFKNLFEIGSDIVVSGLWVAADELYLHVPGLPPIEALPNRAPGDAPQGWRRPLPPQPGRDLVVPVLYVPDAPATEQTSGSGNTEESTDAESTKGSTISVPSTSSEATDEDTLEEDAPTRKRTKADIDDKLADDQPAESEGTADSDAPEETKESKKPREEEAESGADRGTDKASATA
ncbi:hypothetical protein [Mycolicibacterium iranicum]|uniref:PE-PPE domain-containing protein n=1 Tax=Mycolicibacterium iranicum TaxID=912594 RepID=A0ABT4HCJ6_MYCIR|nr:hypothetical protein [Mycolicibacterium iranicum]MCZ0727905.1 hypothetical protein [Mycolicibacterium iranicum]